MGRGSTGLGVVLIVSGLLLYLGQVAGVDIGRVGWPLFVILPGVALLAWGLLDEHGAGAGLVIPGMIVTTVGLVLLYQSSTGHWESWAYAWALVAPGSIGIGVMLHGARRGRPDEVRAGLATAATGLGLFVVFAAFFEGVAHISGRDFGIVGSVGFPLLLIAVGVLILVRRVTARV